MVREIMTPRTDIEALPTEATVALARARLLSCGHSRLPVYHGSIDNVVGVLHARDLFLACWPGLTPVSFSLYGPEETPWEHVRSGLIEALDLAEESVIDQKALKSVGMSVFDRTFAVTRALNGLTLLHGSGLSRSVAES